MKILLDPIYTNSSMARCVTTWMLKKVAQWMIEKIPNCYAYFAVPEGEKVWFRDDVLTHDRVKNIPITKWRDRYREFYVLPETWVRTFSFWGDYGDWDVLISTRGPGMANTRIMSAKSGKKMLILLDPLPIFSFKKTVNVVDGDRENMAYQSLAGYMNCDIAVVNAQHEYDGVLESGRKFLAPKKVLDLESRMHCKWMLSPELLEALPWARQRGPKDLSPIRVIYPQRLDKTERRPENVWEVFRKAFILNPLDPVPIEFEVNTNSGFTKLDDKLHLDFVKFDRPRREQFWENLRRSHVWISWSVEEGQPLSLTEATIWGMIGVVKREPWSEAFMGPDYPWLVGSTDEAVAAIKGIAKDYPAAWAKWIDWYEKFFCPKLVSQGDLLPWLESRIRTWWDATLAKARAKVAESTEERLVHKVQTMANLQKLGKVDQKLLLEMCSNADMTRTDFETTFDRELMNVPLGRGPGTWENKIEMIASYGWRDCLDPWVLERDMPTEVPK